MNRLALATALLLPLLAACANESAVTEASGPMRALNPGKWTATANDIRAATATP